MNSLADRAYTRIRRMICTAELAPGAVVSEAELQAELEMGRTPIREALRTLALERLIDVYPRRGMFVASVDARDLRALSEIREQLEPFAARLAASRRTPEDLEAINALLVDMADIGEDVDRERLIELDERIHRQVYISAHNAFLAAELERTYTHALRIWFLELNRVEHLHDAVLEHREILESIRDADADRAATVMTKHVEAFEAEMRRTH